MEWNSPVVRTNHRKLDAVLRPITPLQILGAAVVTVACLVASVGESGLAELAVGGAAVFLMVGLVIYVANALYLLARHGTTYTEGIQRAVKDEDESVGLSIWSKGCLAVVFFAAVTATQPAYSLAGLAGQVIGVLVLVVGLDHAVIWTRTRRAKRGQPDS